MGSLRVAACQIDSVLGDLDGNAARIVAVLREADAAGCDLAVTPELAVTGYPPEDLVLKAGFVEDNRAVLERIAAATADLRCTAVVGFVDREQSDSGTRYDAAALLQGGRVRGTYRKRLLPNYAVFDEKRYFLAGPAGQPLHRIAGVDVAILVCEDLWEPDPARDAAAAGAKLIVALNASPFYAGRLSERTEVLATRARETGCTIVYVNQVGGQDELVFDGASLVIGPDGTVAARARQFVEDLLVVDIDIEDGVNMDVPGGPRPSRIAPAPDPAEEVYAALVLGTRDYVRKNGFSGALVAMSGGIDSSLVAAIASDALGPENVHGVALPSRYSSEGSLTDAAEVARRVGIDLATIPIEQAHAAFLAMAGGTPHCPRPTAGDPNAPTIDLAEENLQSRIRGVAMMFLSNRNGWIVLTTGNKSELAVGYSTLYGDTAGGFAVIKDVPKTLVYELCRWRNAQPGGAVIPGSVLDKPPSAELRPDQRDDDSLPPYEVLDPILEIYVEGDATVVDLVKRGFDPVLAGRVARLVDLAEYKRRQNPPGVRVTPKAFGKDRRMPITNRYTGL